VRSRCVILVLGILFFIHTDSARAQEAAVRAAISQTLAAVNAGESAIIANFFHQDVRGFFVDRANMIEGFSVLVARAAYLTGLQTDLTMSNLKVTVYSNVAVSAALLQGSVTMPAGGGTVSGTWQYSDTRVLVEGTWKIVQYHISQVAATLVR